MAEVPVAAGCFSEVISAVVEAVEVSWVAVIRAVDQATQASAVETSAEAVLLAISDPKKKYQSIKVMTRICCNLVFFLRLKYLIF